MHKMFVQTRISFNLKEQLFCFQFKSLRKSESKKIIDDFLVFFSILFKYIECIPILSTLCSNVYFVGFLLINCVLDFRSFCCFFAPMQSVYNTPNGKGQRSFKLSLISHDLQTPISLLVWWSIGEEIPKHQHLCDWNGQNGERFGNWPPKNTFIQLFGTFASLGLALNTKYELFFIINEFLHLNQISLRITYQAMMCLVVQDWVETLVDLLGWWFELCQCCSMRINIGGQRNFIANLKVHIDDFMAERWEFVAKTHRIHSIGLFKTKN